MVLLVMLLVPPVQALNPRDQKEGAVVISDRPNTPDLIIQSVRSENSDATSTPVRIRLALPRVLEDGVAAPKLDWAHLTAFLTEKGASDDERVTEASIRVGPEWANRSIVLQVPSPGDGDFIVHVEGRLSLERRGWVELKAVTTEVVSFGDPLVCSGIKKSMISVEGRRCPLLFLEKSSVLIYDEIPGNQRVLKEALGRIGDLCSNGGLRRVSVRGWASTRSSINPTNEELAGQRADAVVKALGEAIPDCSERFYSESIPGVRSVTERFGPPTRMNQCAQIIVEQQSCDSSDEQE